MNSLLKVIALISILPACACVQVDNSGEQRVFEYYAKATLFELCSKQGINRECAQLNKALAGLSPKIYFFNQEYKKEVLVIFELDNFYPYSALGYNKDKKLEPIASGIWFKSKDKFIEAFLEEGSFSE